MPPREITHTLPGAPGARIRHLIIDGTPFPEDIIAAWVTQGRTFVVIHPETARDALVTVDRCPDTGRTVLATTRPDVSLDDLPHWGS